MNRLFAFLLFFVILLLALPGWAQDTNVVANIVPTQPIPLAFTALLGKWAPLYVSITSGLFSLGVFLKPYMASFQHGMNDRLAFNVDILGTDEDMWNRKLLSSNIYRFIAGLLDFTIRLKLPTITGYMTQLKAQSTPGTEPVIQTPAQRYADAMAHRLAPVLPVATPASKTAEPSPAPFTGMGKP